MQLLVTKIFRAYSKRLRAAGFDQCLDLHDKVRSRMLRLLNPTRRFVSWPNRTFIDDLKIMLGLRGYEAPAPTSDLFHRAVEDLVGRSLPRGRMRYYPGPDDGERAKQLLADAGVDARRALIGVAPGANWATKRWPPEYFQELVARLIGEGYQVALQGGPGERELSRQIAGEHLNQGAFDFCGVSLAEMAALIQNCTACVTNDSAPMHLSRALGVPTLAIFGSTDPNMFEYEDQGLAYIEGLECSPCSFYGRKACPQSHFRCMRDQTPARIHELLQPLLDGRPRPYPHA